MDSCLDRERIDDQTTNKTHLRRDFPQLTGMLPREIDTPLMNFLFYLPVVASNWFLE